MQISKRQMHMLQSGCFVRGVKYEVQMKNPAFTDFNEQSISKTNKTKESMGNTRKSRG